MFGIFGSLFQEMNPDQLWTSRIFEHLLCEQQFEVSAPTSETSNRFFFGFVSPL